MHCPYINYVPSSQYVGHMIVLQSTSSLLGDITGQDWAPTTITQGESAINCVITYKFCFLVKLTSKLILDVWHYSREINLR